MGTVACKAKGVYGEPNIYEGKDVVVIYHSSTMGIVVEEGIVVNGQVEIPGTGPLTNERYYIGLKYNSVMKTFPLRAEGKMNAKARLSKMSLYMADAMGEGSVEVGGKSEEPYIKEITYGEHFDGKVDIEIGTSYEEEPYVKIIASGIHGFNLLALDAVYRQYER